MLAEPRQKQRISSDPQNLNWRNDTNAIGKRMMERMGWRDGCGLGKKEKGIKENVRQIANHSLRGFGFNGPPSEFNWTAHDDEFSCLLSQLNEKRATKRRDKAKKMSNSDKARLHANKSSDGHAINIHRKRRSAVLSHEQKIAIFGRMAANLDKNGRSSTSNISENHLEEIGQNSSVENVLPSSAVTMDVYFAKKMSKKLMEKKEGTAEDEGRETAK